MFVRRKHVGLKCHRMFGIFVLIRKSTILSFLPEYQDISCLSLQVTMLQMFISTCYHFSNRNQRMRITFRAKGKLLSKMARVPKNIKHVRNFTFSQKRQIAYEFTTAHGRNLLRQNGRNDTLLR